MFSKNIEKVITIDGMKCEGCAKRVEGVLSNIKDIKKCTVDLKNKEALVLLKKDILNEVIKEKIENIGFKVTKIMTK